MRKNYRAVVIDGKRIIKNLIIFLLILTVTILGAVCFSIERKETTSSAADTALPVQIIESAFPAIHAANNGYQRLQDTASDGIASAASLLFSFNPFDAETILSAEFPTVKLISSGGLVRLALAQRAEAPAATPAPTAAPTPAPTEAPAVIDPERQGAIRAIDAAQKAGDETNIAIGNQTSYPINIAEMLAAPLSFDFTQQGPKVLIVHTHTTEAYSPEGATVYDKEAGDRSNDPSQNVVRVGDIICEVLNNHGIQTLHDSKIHDQPSFNGAYASSLATVEDYLAEYPSIQIVLDVHRDSIVYDDGTKAKVVTDIEGQSAAQLMLVVGTNEGGLYHPDWQENMKFALQLQNAINQRYPSLMRYVNLRRERFNGHTTKGSIILEVGTSGNSLNEAILGARCAAECLAEFLQPMLP